MLATAQDPTDNSHLMQSMRRPITSEYALEAAGSDVGRTLHWYPQLESHPIYLAYVRWKDRVDRAQAKYGGVYRRWRAEEDAAWASWHARVRDGEDLPLRCVNHGPIEAALDEFNAACDAAFKDALATIAGG